MDELVNEQVERRALPAEELRALDQGGERILEGYAAVFNSMSEDLGGFREIVAPGAFKRSLQGNPDVRALFNHDDNQVLGRTAAGTLTLVEDERGLKVRIALPDTQLGRDLYTLVKRGDINQMSFAFRTRKPTGDSWKGNVRTLRDVDLVDTSVVTDPAYKATVVSARALAMAAEMQHESESNGQEPVEINETVPAEDDTRARLDTLAKAIDLRKRRVL